MILVSLLLLSSCSIPSVQELIRPRDSVASSEKSPQIPASTSSIINPVDSDTNQTSGPLQQPTTEATTVQTTLDKEINTTLAPSISIRYFVANSGDDSNPGTAALPFKTIQAAIGSVPPESTIFVTTGTYNEKLIIRKKSGLTIRNKPGDIPIIAGTGYSSGYLIEISNSNRIEISGFEICNFIGLNLEGIMIQDVCNEIEINQCKFHNISTTRKDGNAHVILANGNSDTPEKDITVRDNQIYHCDTGWSESITMTGNIDEFTIKGNWIHDVTNIAIDAVGFYSCGCTIPSMNQARNGIIFENRVSNVVCPYASCSGIYVDGARNITIEQNTIHNSQYGIEIGCENPTDEVNPSVPAVTSEIIVRNNIIYNNFEIGIAIGGYNGLETGLVSNCQIYNNTCCRNHVEVELARCDSILLTKNIFYSAGGSDLLISNDPANTATNLSMYKNIYYAELGMGNFILNDVMAKSFSKWQQVTDQDWNSRFTDPLFINIGALDFRLQSGSSAMGFGALG